MKVELTLTEIRNIEQKLQKFTRKVEAGKARSKETYEDLKQILAFLEDKKKEALECRLTKSSPGKQRGQTEIHRKEKE